MPPALCEDPAASASLDHLNAPAAPNPPGAPPEQRGSLPWLPELASDRRKAESLPVCTCDHQVFEALLPRRLEPGGWPLLRSAIVGATALAACVPLLKHADPGRIGQHARLQPPQHPARAAPRSGDSAGDTGRVGPVWDLGPSSRHTASRYLLPDMEQMVGLTGSVAFSIIGFVMPGLLFLKLRPPAHPPPSHGGAAAAEPASDGGGAASRAPPTSAWSRVGVAFDVGASVLLVVVGVVGGAWGVVASLRK